MNSILWPSPFNKNESQTEQESIYSWKRAPASTLVVSRSSAYDFHVPVTAKLMSTVKSSNFVIAGENILARDICGEIAPLFSVANSKQEL